ncbi:MAG: DUF6531 domain-containing protein, partial [Candidatus Gracilibacteria bacterium]|nr:DUF6531 domain-containing protein [Candidatus Gracilibacteria bacterium]
MLKKIIIIMILLFGYGISNGDFETTPIDLNTGTLGNLSDFTGGLGFDPIDFTGGDMSSGFTGSISFTSTNDYSNLKITGLYNCDTKVPSVRLDVYDTENNIVYTDLYNKTDIITVGCGGNWLDGYQGTGNTCKLLDVIYDGNDYFVNYQCTINEWWVPGAASGGNSRNKDTIWTGSFKTSLDLCLYNNSFCKSFSYLNFEQNNSNQFPWQNIPSGKIDTQTLIDDILTINNGISSDEICSNTSIGDPVNLNTGEFAYDNTLMQYKSKGIDFNFDVTYKNQSYYNGPIGNNFDFGYNQFLIEDSNGNINYHNGRLGAFKFVKNENGFEYNSTLNAELKIINSKYDLVFNNTKTYVFGENLKLESIRDINGNTMTFSYNADNALIKIIDTLNREYNITYNENSRIQNITDFNNNKVEFTYFDINETEGNQFDLKTIKMINGTSEKEISFTYTIGTDFKSSHNIVKLIDSANNTYVENIYDTNDRVFTQTYGNGTIYYDYTLDTNNKITKNSVIDREGNVIDYYYDDFGNTIKKIVKKSSGDLEYNNEYNTSNYISKEILPLGNGFTYSYDSKNNLLEKRQKQDVNTVDSIDDIVTKITYDQVFNKATQIISSNGAITNLTLDNNGNVIKKEVLGVKDLDGNNLNIVETYEYNNAGELNKIIDANGNETTLEYTNGNLVKSSKGTFLNNIETNYNYDAKGNIISITDGEGNITNLSYDDFNLLNSLTTPEGITSEYTYNKLNKKTNESIILGDLSKVSTSYSYDILDNPTNITSDIDVNKEKTIVTKYDKNSNITEIKDGNNAIIQFTYNEENFITSKTIINGTDNITTNYEYDINNRLTKQILPNGNEISFEYDLFDRIIKQINSNNFTVFTYDKSGNILETKIYNNSNELLQKSSNTYDLLNRKTSETTYDLEDNSEITNSYNYDNVGNITKTISPNLNETNFEYDSFNRQVKTIDNLGNILENTYNKNDKITQTKLIQTNGKTITTKYEYDKDNRLTKEIDNLGNSKIYTYNNLNQVTSFTNGNGVTTNYTYDYNGNVLTETTENKTISYEYDIYGNKTKLIDANENETNYEFDELNRLIKQIYSDS